jgi:para-nitrobenzyl esterase
MNFRWIKILRTVSLPLLSLVGLPAGYAGAAAPSGPPAVQVSGGKVQGVLTADGKVVAYKGIPFAAPPVEELRWKPPQPAGRWKGVLQAREFGAHCIQAGSYPDMVFHDPGASENCLTLNVWAPAGAKPLKKPGGLPVMVWIYGGGFTTGGTSESRQDGQFLAHRGVVVISMNYRLGIFGFMALPELSGESPNQASGNYGLMDQAAAIAWAKRNAASFGGDPSNITIFGESAGSFSVSAQMASPVAKDLFARAIGESGGAFYSGGLGFPSRQTAEQADAAWAEKAFGASKLFLLRQIPAEEVAQKATARATQPPRFGPDIDGWFLPDTVPNLYAAGKQSHIPVLGGWNANEQTARATAASFAETARKDFGADAASFLAVYPASTDAEAARSAGDYASDRFIAFSTWAWLEAQTKTGGAPVYRYFFTLGNPGDKNHRVSDGTFHSDDIEYVFGALDSRPEMAIRPEDRALSDQMQQYWVNFAKTGDPNGAGLPKWPAYNSNSGWQVMVLDATPEAKPDPNRGRDLFLDSVWGKAAGK